ncbi:phosphoribosylaminoimidazolecarboxamide formyltransferase/IMP cyclohydrolase [Ruminiclostridium sufflavum DSM 19573]|uniref:Bifunctional purine biosynthesis protein PurH n=1 Tax=Ruminiclostridium sufflavum DSM 19573 TaxID=1121337 RepID=A0A318XIC1_9FIRM|nr:bifunctional phosphoribosylaminoimidazolecarboxamide formyltransferase/IMP cyclohydrolase [Ruminiclostridium sufflavum]PYG86935.1 phosphoribosylaminoimidazolecarboxamide formyltransferase/IMP cyclohydrolase [Ruminiclostridium sufflavum DSM 19573]
MIKRALISVSDKTGIIEFASALVAKGIEIISTGGTEKALSAAGIKVTNISDVTGFPECLDGRVKTLHPKVHAGILAMRSNEEHMKQIKELGVDTIDLVVINLYPFKQTILKDGVELEEAIENIDIGGPTMIRAAAKNYQDVAVVVDPADYVKILAEINETGEVDAKTKFRLAYKVFEHTSQYDTLIAKYLRDTLGDLDYPETLSVTFEKAQEMRYGENPHQSAVFYKEVGANRGLLPSAVQLHGKELSFNNINDTNGALMLLKEFDEPAVVAVKHTNPCGVGSADNIYDAYIRAYESDPTSIYGGIIAANREIDLKTAEEINKIFIEIVIAPSFSEEAFAVLSQKKNIRLLKLEAIEEKAPAGMLDMKKIAGGLLVQKNDSFIFNEEELKCVTKVQPTKEQMEDLKFAMKVVKHAKSNAIVVAKDMRTLGVGPGQTNRILSARVAIEYAGERSIGAVMASDAFFPFSDCVEVAAGAGIKAIIQPGGSIRDQESIDACNKYGIAMVFTGMRHFKH